MADALVSREQLAERTPPAGAESRSRRGLATGVDPVQEWLASLAILGAIPGGCVAGPRRSGDVAGTPGGSGPPWPFRPRSGCSCSSRCRCTRPWRSAPGRPIPLFGDPVPVWSPLGWNSDALRSVLRQISSPDGVFFTPMLRTIAYTVVATTHLLGDRLSGRVLRCSSRGQTQGACCWRCCSRRSSSAT